MASPILIEKWATGSRQDSDPGQGDEKFCIVLVFVVQLNVKLRDANTAWAVKSLAPPELGSE